MHGVWRDINVTIPQNLVSWHFYGGSPEIYLVSGLRRIQYSIMYVVHQREIFNTEYQS